MKKIVTCLLATLGLTSACAQQNFEDVDVKKFSELIGQPSTIVLDVRTAEEFKEEHIEGAISIDQSQSDFVEKVKTLVPSDKTVCVYCRSGRRSANAAKRLSDIGYKCINLKGGIIAWKEAGLPVTTASYETDTFKTQSGKTIRFSLNMPYMAKGESIEGEQVVEFSEGGIAWRGRQYRELSFVPKNAQASFSLHDVTIGIDFHWERKEVQTFRGALRLVVEADKVCAINLLPVEEYLTSVISSEMKATASDELLKAHAVISRSWLLAQMERRNNLKKAGENFFSFVKKDDELIKWYDREDHTIFDVCADDHCQRYQGITRAVERKAAAAVEATRGQVLVFDGDICDARFSKCCGGVTEEFQYCWDNLAKPYLRSVPDRAEGGLIDLRVEQNARKWILDSPEAYCNTSDAKVLQQVLNDYDTETSDFYRWRVVLSQEEVARLVADKLKMDFGGIKALTVVERGRSGRISKLRIEGTEHTLTIGKELEIRRALSETHLLSSAFVVDTEGETDGLPARFILHGAGWGHGVGLCQIGAAMMGEKGFSYDQILLHYYRGAQIKKLYR